VSALFFFLACLAQQPPTSALGPGLKRVQELALAAQKDEALALCEELSAGRTSRERAALEYARGVVHAGANEREPARECFERSRADGAGELRLSSMYNLGSLALEQGEEWYHKLPEVSGQPAAAPPPAGPAQGAPPGPDALAEARKSYLAARERFVERLRAQWNDADTRADVELVQRRLKRLDEIEKQRKEEQQKKDQQKQQDSKDPKSQQDKPDSKDKPDPDKQPQDPKDKDKDQQKQDPQQPDPADKDKQKQDPQKPDPQKPEDQPQPGEQPKPAPQDAPPPQLSKEEVTRLLDKLQQLEDQASKLRAQIHKARRVAVKKDW